MNTEEKEKGTTEKREVEIWMYNNKVKDIFRVIANGVPILSEHNPYAHKELPYWTLYDYKEPGKFWGIGEMEITHPFSKSKNRFGNMILDQAEYSINKPLVMMRDTQFSDTDDNIPTWGPGYILEYTGTGSFQFMDTPPVGADAWQSIDYINNEITVATGVDARSMISEQRSETATKEALMKESQTRRIASGESVNNVCGYQRMAKLRKANIRQFLKIKRAYKMAPDLFTEAGYKNIKLYDMALVKKGEGFELVEDKGAINYFEASPKNIRNDFDVIIQAQDTMSSSKTLDKAMAQELLDKSAPFANLPGVTEGLPWLTILKKMWKLQGFTDEELAAGNKAQKPDIENAMEILKGKVPQIEPGEDHYEHIASHTNLVQQLDKEMELKMKRRDETPPEAPRYQKIEAELEAMNAMRAKAVKHIENHEFKAQQELDAIEIDMPEGANPPLASADEFTRTQQNQTAEGNLPPGNVSGMNKQNMGERLGTANALPTV